MFSRDFIKNNFGWKVASLLLATLVWFTIKGVIQNDSPDLPGASASVVRIFTALPIKLLVDASETRRFTISPSAVTVTLRGHPSILESLSREQVHAFVDVTDALSFRDSAQMIQVQPLSGVKVLDTNPATVRVQRSEDNLK